MKSFSSSITCTPCSKLAVPFWPADAKWPLTAILSGAVKDLFTAVGRRDDEAAGDSGGESVEAMTASE